MKPLYKSVIFSPHPDDAVFSIGALLLSGVLGKMKVVNVFSRSKYTIHHFDDEFRVTSKRKEEDRKAMKYLGADVVYWDYQDSSLRSAYKNEEQYLDPANNPEADNCFESLSALIQKEMLINNRSLFFVPLGLGSHIDHRIISFICSAIRNVHIAYYEDGSYFNGNSDAAKKLADEMHLSNVVSIDSSNQSEKMQLVNFYESQVNDEIRNNLESAYVQNGGERIWFSNENAKCIQWLKSKHSIKFIS